MKNFLMAAGVVVVALALVFLSVLSIRSGTGGVSETKKNTTTEKVTEMGSIESGEFNISFLKAYRFSDYEDHKAPAEGNEFYCVEVEAKNLTKSVKSIYRTEFTCYADEKEVPQTLFSEADFIWGDVNSGETAGGKLYFEVPKDAKSIKVEYKNNSFDDTTGVFFEIK